MTRAAGGVYRIVAGFLRRNISPKEEICGIIATDATAVLKRRGKISISRTGVAGGVYRTDANFLHRITFRKEDICATVAAVAIAENCRIKKSD
jgi:hypothetical protein